jgi:hypothetical protein
MRDELPQRGRNLAQRRRARRERPKPTPPPAPSAPLSEASGEYVRFCAVALVGNRLYRRLVIGGAAVIRAGAIVLGCDRVCRLPARETAGYQPAPRTSLGGVS